MPNAQSEFPLTLAEVLFEEFEATRGSASENKWEALEKEIEEIEKKIEEIRALPTFARKRIELIWAREEMKGEPADEELSDLIWKCKKELSKKLVPRLYAIIRRRPGRLSALCLSGGGVLRHADLERAGNGPHGAEADRAVDVSDRQDRSRCAALRAFPRAGRHHGALPAA